MNVKTVETWVKGESIQDGAGVKLKRILTQVHHQRLDPWLMLDKFGSDQAQDYIAGFPPHPHRGFETITYMIEGRMAHRDNHGNAGIVEAGGIQWMRAAKGIVHEEMPAQEAGLLRGFQFWLNLPAVEKMTEPSWQDVKADDIPCWQSEALMVKVIAGSFLDVQGVIQREATQPMILDVAWQGDASLAIAIPSELSAFVYLYQGQVTLNEQQIPLQQMGILSLSGDTILLNGQTNGRLLVVAGKPLKEPISAGGPFVMNHREEIVQAFEDYRQGTF